MNQHLGLKKKRDEEVLPVVPPPQIRVKRRLLFCVL
jgi:hypothetical protein